MLFNTALQNLPHGLVMFDANDRLIICNGRYAELYGLAPERMQPGASLRDVIDARVAAGSFPPNPDKYAVDRLAALSISKRCSFVDELTNGRVFSIVWQPMPDGGSIAIHQDITERHLAETRAAEAHRQVTEKQYAIDQAVIVAVTDVTGRITYVNDNFCRISGYAREELVGAESSDFEFRRPSRAILSRHLPPNRRWPSLARRGLQQGERRLVILGRHHHRPATRSKR